MTGHLTGHMLGSSGHENKGKGHDRDRVQGEMPQDSGSTQRPKHCHYQARQARRPRDAGAASRQLEADWVNEGEGDGPGQHLLDRPQMGCSISTPTFWSRLSPVMSPNKSAAWQSTSRWRSRALCSGSWPCSRVDAGSPWISTARNSWLGAETLLSFPSRWRLLARALSSISNPTQPARSSPRRASLKKSLCSPATAESCARRWCLSPYESASLSL